MSQPTITTATTDPQGFILSGSGASVSWNDVVSADNWNVRTPPQPVCEVSIAGIAYPHYEPPPNAFVRFFQKRLLGITWRDLRPERAMQELKGLK